MKKGLHELVIIADRSGSMSGMIEEARNSINRLIDEQKQVDSPCNFTFVMFDNEYDMLHKRVDLKDMPHIGEEYSARGCTALLDAVGKTINTIGEEFSKSPEDEKPEKVIVTIVTDGHENASQEFNKKQIADMIKHQKEKYSWEFHFVGANIDSFSEGASLNIDAVNTMNFAPTRDGILRAYSSISTSYTKSRTSLGGE